MYLNADDARSDFFLAAAVYVIGPALVSLLQRAIPGFFALGGIAVVLSIVLPFLLVAAMPLYLMHYREESFADLFSGSTQALALGAGLGGVLAAGNAVAAVIVSGIAPSQWFTLLPIQGWLGLGVRWASLGVLAIFLYRRAEYAFRPISESQSTLVRQAGYACVGTGVVSTLLLLLGGSPLVSVLAAAGLVGAYFLAERQLPQAGLGERWWVWAPVITLALGPLEIFSALFDGQGFARSAQTASVVATFGLITVMALHNRRGGKLVFGMAITFAVSSVLAVLGGTGFVA